MARPPPCCWCPTMTMTWNGSCWGVLRDFKLCSTAPGKASKKGKACRRRLSGRLFGNENKNENQRLRKGEQRQFASDSRMECAVYVTARPRWDGALAVGE